MNAAASDRQVDAPREALFLPMSERDVAEVMVLEVAAYAFPWTRGNFVDSLRHGYAGVCLRVDARLVGYFIAMAVVDELHLLNVCVAPAEQGRGYGRALMEQVRALAAATGMASVLLEVRPSNARALGLYERLGFERVGQRRAYYPAAGGLREDAIVMRLSL
ncbi:ribosomal protein S18-alanine N-acetyltransferase [Chitinasiproducens palmae]|uniref:[Ribosomal protein bS18]-alanine N-acetyltransferase n=1 Tax=Chitinasiproducens palmae TaxID=1770053 RepID=A0A1H2PLU3_9BURK|nr:ribosomal protein S18-alanine N-acetyltransferase [Chitinasiproducens palmae]SDV47515.1 [SSU ribosomal protein S18P]-alanine acetyltransferase [Chitinasiproducens palmae]